ncbi:hypothetical protein BKA23_2397 [Rudaeicoccus suwonensis]|uniref:Uncharacterized protein n=1 Tax=Rudaeicoccus suwonensis TaxID=657409 RepID=A0A561E372_9MICO|nr:hypothetical protein BKA23_2397 [Rudaeicoccus suwonensis]
MFFFRKPVQMAIISGSLYAAPSFVRTRSAKEPR